MKVVINLLLFIAIVVAKEDQLVNKEFLDGYNKFTSDVYNELEKTNSGSFVVSPLSVDVILALAEYGSKGETSKQLVKGLGLPKNKSKLSEAIAYLTPKLNVNDSYSLTSANKIYVKEGYKLRKDFEQFAVNVYHAEVENINFEAKTAADTINKWVEETTVQKIRELINQSDLDKDTRTVLLNSLYFHGGWKTEFYKHATRKGTFYLDKSGTTEVDFMKVTEIFKYYENNKLNAKFLELPYLGNDVSFIVALPNEIDGLPLLEKNLYEALDTSQYQYTDLSIKLPKFSLETTIEFKPILQKLGIVNAFEDNAEFPGITDEPLKISKVVQKAIIEVEEEGTTAAAATAVIATNSVSEVIDPKPFVADHPFLFAIKYGSVVLFVGRYNGK